MLIVALLAFLIAPAGRPDPEESLASAVERIVAQREDGFRFDGRGDLGGGTIVQYWTPLPTSGATPTPLPAGARPPLVKVQITRFASDVEAKQKLEWSVLYTQLSPSGSVDSLGDQSVLYLNGVPGHEYTSVRFRRANVMVTVSTDGRKVAERFAFRVLAAIEDRLNVSTRGLIAK
jgi:hypothetical protein